MLLGQSGTGCSGHCGHARHAGHAGQAGHGGSRVLYFWRRQPPQCAHSEPADQLGSLGGRGVLSSSFSPFSRASPVCPGKGKSVLKLLPQGCLGAEACWEGGTRYPPNPPLKVCFSSWGHFGKFQIGFSYIHLLWNLIRTVHSAQRWNFTVNILTSGQIRQVVRLGKIQMGEEMDGRNQKNGGEGQDGRRVGGQLGMSWLFVIEYTALRNDSEDCALWKDTVWLT